MPPSRSTSPTNSGHLATGAERPAKRARTAEPPEEGEVVRKLPVEPKEEEWDDQPEDEVVPVEEDGGKNSDLYLDTVNRQTLDFDFEKLCSVSLSNINIYGCLVCGKYFQGRGKSTHAYAHSIHEDHHVFINLETQKFYVLPDGYEVVDPSLEDISALLAPTFTPAQIASFSYPLHIQRPSFDLINRSYLPGYVGLNNIKRNDYLNVVIHLLLHVPQLRDFLLLYKPPAPTDIAAANKAKMSANPSKKHTVPPPPSELVKRFSMMAKKLWNPRLFKAQVSPHEFLQEVTRASGGRFKITEQGDPIEFLGWLLNRLHLDLGGSKKKGSSIIYSTFQGELRVDVQQVIVRADWEGNEKTQFIFDKDTKTQKSPFLFLALDLPPPPLFQDAVEKNIIPQVTLAAVLAKYDGKTAQESGGQLRRYKCERLPPYIILHFKRFTKNNFVEEKNPTVVNFPLKNVDFAEYVDLPPSAKDVPTQYDLIANVTHESTAGTTRDKANTVWKAQVRAGCATGTAPAGIEEEKWFQIQDLTVETIQKEMIFLGEVVLQIWQRRDLGAPSAAVAKKHEDVEMA